MDQFDKSIKIGFELNNVESIRAALQEYQELLKEDKAVVDEVFQVEFVKLINNRMHPLQAVDGEPELFEEMRFTNACDLYRENIELNGNASEAIFFAHALKHEEMLQEVVNTAKEMAAYARRHNDTWEMWVDDMGVFGIDALYVLARRHPEYAYFIGGFIIPYWDSEHASYVFEYMASLYITYGMDDNMLKMFCYCDNEEARQSMIGCGWYIDMEDSLDLAAYFKENPERYAKFKEILLERFKDQPFLQYSDSEHTERPIHSFYQTIMSSSMKDIDIDEDDESVMEAEFITDTFDNEASQLHKQIEAAVGKALTEPYVDPYEEDDYDDYDEDDDLWENLFLEGFEDGEEIWNYILYGEDDSILEELEPIDLEKLAAEKGLKIQKRFNYYLGGIDTLRGEFHNIFNEFIGLYYEEPEDDNGFIININGRDVTGRETVIRAIEVFHKLMGEKPFAYDFYEEIITGKIMKPNAFSEKFDQQCKDFDGTLAMLIDDYMRWGSEAIGGELDRIYMLINSDREAALKVMKPNYFLFSIAMYILHKDYRSNMADALTKHLMEYVETHWAEMLLTGIKEESSLKPQELEQLKLYIQGPQMPPQELLMKVMKGGMDTLSSEEKVLFESLKQQKPLKPEDVLPLLKEKLNQEVCEGDPQIHYDLLDPMDSGFCVLLSSLFLSVRRMRLPSSQAMTRAVRLFAMLAPIKVINSAAYLYHYSCRVRMETAGIWYDFDQDIKSIGVSPAQILAWEILKRDEDYIDTLVEAYIDGDDDSGYSFIKSTGRSDIEEALALIPEDDKRRFMEKVIDEDPSLAVDSYNEYFNQGLEEFIEDNISCMNDYIQPILKESPIKAAGEWKDMKNYHERILEIDTGMTFTAEIENETPYTIRGAYLIFTEDNQGELKLLLGKDYLTHLQHEMSKEDEKCYYADMFELYILNDDELDLEDRKKLSRSMQTRKEELLKAIQSYVDDNVKVENLDEMLKELVDVSGSSSMNDAYWKIDETKQTRMLSLLVKLGVGGLHAVYDEDEIDAEDYLEEILYLGAPKQDVFKFLVDTEDEDAFSSFVQQVDAAPLCMKLSIQNRIKAVQLADYSGDLFRFLGNMASDPSDRVRDAVEESLKNHSVNAYEEYGYILVEIHKQSTEQGKKLLQGVMDYFNE